jgi:hypothetical protein
MSGLRRIYVFFYLAGLAVVALAGWMQRAPGYMDADYYYAGGQMLIAGSGLRQAVLWNYLDAPDGLPAAGFTYWMPLASFLSAAGSALGGGFLSARIPFWLLAAAIAPLTVRVGMDLHGDRRKAILGGFFALFPVYYLAYLPTTDVFAGYMLLGSGILLTCRMGKPALARWFACGLMAGLMHLFRADGIFWLGGVLLFAAGPLLKAFWTRRRPETELWLAAAAAGLAVLAGYLLPMSFWYARNLQEWGWIFPPGSGRTLWLTRYEDTFVYPAGRLTPQRWLASEWGAILAVRGEALGTNLQTWLAVQGGVVLLPFALGGLWLLRRLSSVRFGAGMWLATFGVMSVVFPFAGINGAFFHSGAALQPLLWAAAPVGIEAAVGWLARRRGWQKGKQVLHFVEGLLLASCVVLSLLLYFQRVIGGNAGSAEWNRSDQHYRAVEERLVELGATPCLVVMVNNPPGYYAAAKRSSVVIPYGDETMVLQAAEQYDVSYLILEQNDGGHLPRLFNQPGDGNGLKYLGELAGTKLYAFTHSP